MTRIDHSHCWSSKRPPCGQKIKHLECCLCQALHPDVVLKSEFKDKFLVLAAQEINIARLEEGLPTSRLTSLTNQVFELLK